MCHEGPGTDSSRTRLTAHPESAHFFSTSFIPHFGQLPGLSCTTSGCIGQVYCTAFSLFVEVFSPFEQPTTTPPAASAITTNATHVLFNNLITLSQDNSLSGRE